MSSPANPTILTSSIPLPANAAIDHCLIKAGEKLYLFNRRLYERTHYDWQQRVLFKGGYVCVFHLETREWETLEYPAITDCDNTGEIVFVHEDTIHVLLYTNYDTLEFTSMHRWTGKGFEQVPMENKCHVLKSETEHNSRVTMVLADGECGAVRYIVSNMCGHRLHRLDLSTGTLEDVMNIDTSEKKSMFARGLALSAHIHGSRLTIAYGVRGCQFNWDAAHFIQCNLDDNTVKQTSIPPDTARPPFQFTGAALTMADGSRWMHVAGTLLVAMSDTRFDGSAWCLHTDSMQWNKLRLKVAEGAIDYAASDGRTIYFGGSDVIYTATI